MRRAFLLFPWAVSAFAEDVTVGDVQAPETSLIQTVILIVIMAAFFYFIMYRPEQKRRKLLQQQRSSMKKGDRVVAIGIIGTVDSIGEKSAVLRMIDGTRIEVLQAAITEVMPSATVDHEAPKP